MTDEKRAFDRLSLRSEFQSLFWNVLLTRKRETGFTFKTLADKLRINKSYISRSFSSPPNWQIDKLADMADALGVHLVVEARDREDPRVVYTASGTRRPDPVKTATAEKGEAPPVPADEQRSQIFAFGEP
jgi:ribosome-binding protein aMBF1 (putative translation factor)